MKFDEPRPFVFFGARTNTVRLFSIGPQHLDWLCAFCGKTGGFDGGRLARWVLALDQVNIAKALEEDSIASFDRAGWRLARRRCLRSGIEHLQQHLRFERVDGGLDP